MANGGKRLPTLFISHGGGPWPFMRPTFGPPDMWDDLDAFLQGIDRMLGRRPMAALVISGHWEEAQPTVNSYAKPPLLFDYYGFPEHTYHLSYPAPGSSAIAVRVRELLGLAGIESATDEARGLDHGVFIPFMRIYPEADVPIVQLSLRSDLQPEFHLALGRALTPLRNENVLIVGSGLSYHNLQRLRSMDEKDVTDARRFDAWLIETVEHPDAAERNKRLAEWERAPAARACHPRSDHLMPLHVVAGAAGEDRGRCCYRDEMLGKPVSAFCFG